MARKKKYSSPTIGVNVQFSEDAYEHLMKVSYEREVPLRDMVAASTLLAYGLADAVPDAEWNVILNGTEIPLF